MNTQADAHLQPHPKLVPAFLAWTFGWSWGFWGLCILLKNLWPENPPMPYLLLEGTLFTIGVFGPMTASLIVLKKRGLKTIRTYLFSGRKGTWAYFLIHAGALITVYALVAGIRLVEAGILAILPLEFIFMTTLGGGVEEPGWRGFLQLALEKKFSFPLATILVGTVWALWHLPFWFYGRFADWGGLDSFPFFWISLIAVAFWLSALYKKTQSLIACNLFHVLYNTVTTTFVGISEATDGDFSKVNPIFYFGGLALLTLYSMSLWYRTDKKEGRQKAKHF